MKKNKTILWIAIFVVVLVVGGFAYQKLSANNKASTAQMQKKEDSNKDKDSQEAPTDKDEASDEAQSTMAPDFTLEDGNGNKVTLSDLRGKYVILNFWATWCVYCKEEMPDFNQYYKDELKDNDQVAFYAINVTDGQRETKEKAEEYLKKNHIDLPVLYDTTLDVSMAYGASGLPTTVIIDKEGNIYGYQKGLLDVADLKAAIDEVLK